MNLPRFLSEEFPGYSRHALIGCPAMAADEAEVVPAMMDATQRAFRDCVLECDDPRDAACVTSCRREYFPTRFGPPSTPPALEACCIQNFAFCIASSVASSNYVGIAKCVSDAYSCTTSPTSACARYM